MKRSLPALLLALAFVAPLYAGEFKLPEESPKISIQLPEEWETEETDTGLEANNKDGTVFLALDSAPTQEALDELMENMRDLLKEQGKTIDLSKGKEGAREIAGVPAKEITYEAADENGRALVTMSTFQLDGVFFLLTQSVPQNAAKGDLAEIKKAVGSLVALGRAQKKAPASAADPAASADPKPAKTAPAKPAENAPPKPEASPAATAAAKPAAGAGDKPGTAAAPATGKPAASGEKFLFPSESPLLSFQKPTAWSSQTGKNGAVTIAGKGGITSVNFTLAGAQELSDAQIREAVEETLRKLGAAFKDAKPGSIQDAALGGLKGLTSELTGETQGQTIRVKFYLLRSPKGRCVGITQSSTVALKADPETLAIIDSVVAFP